MTFRDGQLQTAGGRRVCPGVILALVCAAQFMVILDLVVVNVALPAMQKDLRLGPSDLQWVAITYGLAFGGFLLLAARGVQGLGAAMAAPAALSVLAGAFADGPARSRALGIFGGVAGSAACLGLLVSGLLVGGPGWRWIFLINVPIGIVLAGFVLTCVPRGGQGRGGSADVLGAVTVTTGLLGIVYAINKSADYGWTSPATLGVLVGAAAMLGLFLIVEQRLTAPLIPLSMFGLKTLTTATIVAGKVSGMAGGMISTAQEAGAALGLAIIATAALARSAAAARAAGSQTAVRAVVHTAGFQRGALVAAGFSIAAALVTGLLLRRAEHDEAPARPQEPAPEPVPRAA